MSEVWADAVLAARLFAIDPSGAGGIAVRAPAGPVRDRLLAVLRAALPVGAPWKKMPFGIGDSRLLGGLDLTATMRAGRPVGEAGLLAEADGGVVLVAMAERLGATTAARLAAVMDQGEVAVARDGVEQRRPARFGLVLLDEGADADERAPAALLDRTAFAVDLDGLGVCDLDDAHEAGLSDARARLPTVAIGADLVDALSDTATALGVASLRASVQAVRVARAAAALRGLDAVTMAEAEIASRLVFAPRATCVPAEPPPSPEEAEPAPSAPPAPETATSDQPPPDDRRIDPQQLEDMLVEAARAALPPGVLDLLRSQSRNRARAASLGRAGALSKNGARGRPAGTRAGDPVGGARLNVIETLRAAAPWQRLRTGGAASGRIAVRREDFRVTRHQPRTGTTTIFVVDASGSAAVNRLAEAKGAVELLLADCYVRRDQVAVVAFRGTGAQVLLPPTRSLVRAKRELASLPAGGGTPLAAGIDAARALADAVRRRGETPSIVVLTDGRANVARDGMGGRARAAEEAASAARLIRAAGFPALLVDTSIRPQADSAKLAAEMGARYLPLPFAEAAALSRAVRRPPA